MNDLTELEDGIKKYETEKAKEIEQALSGSKKKAPKKKYISDFADNLGN